MTQLIVDTWGAFIGIHSERLQVRKGKEVTTEVPLMELDSVLIVARGVSISSDAIYECAEAGIPIHFITYAGKPYARIVSSALTGTVQTRRAQLLAYEDQRGVILGKAFALGKLGNQANQLRYMAKYRKNLDRALYYQTTGAAADILALSYEVERLDAPRIDDIRAQLMNLEGRAAEIYWNALRRLLLVETDWQKREARGAEDPVNAALNYGYGILYGEVEKAIILAGLDPYAGFVHVDRPGKPSLVLDLIEEFRQPVVDRTIFGQLNKGVTFELDEKGLLKDKSRKTIIEKVTERLEGQARYEGKKHRLRVIIQSQARHLATYLRGERGTYKPFICSW